MYKRQASNKLLLLWHGLTAARPPQAAQPYLERMGLLNPTSMQDKVVRALLIEQLESQGAI